MVRHEIQLLMEAKESLVAHLKDTVGEIQGIDRALNAVYGKWYCDPWYRPRANT